MNHCYHKMLPTEIYHCIVSKMDGFERENMRLVCKMFNEFKFVISSKNPARDREVLLIDCNRRFYELFQYGHLDIIKQCYKRYGNHYRIIQYACKYGFTEFVKDLYVMRRAWPVVISLACVCDSGSIDAINMAIQYGANDYVNGLRKLCEKGNLELFEYLLALSHISPVMDDFISEACISGNIDIVKRVMEFPVSEDNVWDVGLMSACEGGHLDIINLMIGKGANDWDSGLYGACAGGYLDIINLMIGKGANDWDLGFHGACEGGHFDIVKMMIDMGATDISNIGPACSLGNIEIVKLVLKTAEIDDHNLLSGFNIAISSNHIELVKLLAKDSFIRDSLWKITEMTGIDILEFLVKRGAIISKDILKRAISHQDINQLKYLLENGGEITPGIIKWARFVGDRRIIKYLESRY